MAIELSLAHIHGSHLRKSPEAVRPLPVIVYSGSGLTYTANAFESLGLVTHSACVSLSLHLQSGAAYHSLVFEDVDLGSSPGWWAASVATYCPSRMEEHSKFKSTKPSCQTTSPTLYMIGVQKIRIVCIKSLARLVLVEMRKKK